MLDLSHWGWLSVAAAITTLGLKSAAWVLTGSVGMMSDALESLVNLAAGLLAVYSLRFAAQPPDAEHPHGHGKIEYFTSGIEGALILFAGGGIILSAAPRFLHPVAVTKLDLGLLLSTAATVVNLIVGLLLRRATAGLLDAALPVAEQAIIEQILQRFVARGMQYHALRTRLAGRRRFVSVHLLLPPDWTVLAGHQLAEDVERAIRDELAGAVVFTHIEPLSHPDSDADIPLDRF